MRPAARATSPRPRGHWRTPLVIGEFAALAVFAFCVIAPAYGFRVPMAKPGIAVSAVAMFACAVTLSLTGDDE